MRKIKKEIINSTGLIKTRNHVHIKDAKPNLSDSIEMIKEKPTVKIVYSIISRLTKAVQVTA